MVLISIIMGQLSLPVFYIWQTYLQFKNKAELFPEMTVSILETAYKEDGCTDEIGLLAFKQFVSGSYFKQQRDGKAWKLFLTKIIEPDEPVSGRIYLSDIYKN